MEPLLVGREPELAALESALDAASREERVLIEVSGEPGIGKTRLIAELRARARDRGFAVLDGTATEFERERPLAVLQGRAAGPEWTAGVERFVLFRRLTARLAERADGRPLLVAWDDMHWADDASCEFLDHLLHHPPACPLAVAVAYRNRQAAYRLAAVLSGTHSGVRRVTCEVGPLPEDAAARLTDRPCPDGGGNPLYLLASASAAGGEGTSAAALFAAEFAGLDASARLVAQAASVLGEPFTAEQAGRVAAVPSGAVLDALDALAARDLIRELDAACFDFRHPLVRAAAYTLPGGTPAEAHGRAARVLADAGRPVEEYAHHVVRSARPGDVHAVELLVTAANVVLAGAPVTAVRWIEAALALLPPGRPDHRLRLTLARAHHARGRFAESRDLLADALRDRPWGDAHDRDHLALLSFHAMLGHHLGDLGAAADDVGRELERLPADRPDLVAALHLERAGLCESGGDFAAARESARRALDALPDDRVVQARALTVLGLVDLHSGRAGAGERLIRTAAETTDGLLDPELAPVPSLGWTLAWAEVQLERFADADRHFARTLRLTRAAGRNEYVHECLVGRATAGLWLGRVREARAHAADALALAETIRSPEMAGTALIRLCQADLWGGDERAAVECGHRAVAALRGERSPWLPTSKAVLGMAHIVAAETAAVPDVDVLALGRALLLEAGGGADLPELARSQAPMWFELLSRAELLRDDRAAAERWAALCVAAAEEAGSPGRLAYADLATARLLSDQDPSAAALLAERAAHRFAATGVRLWEGQALVLAGTCHGLAGDVTAARRSLGRARTLFTGCGAPAWADHAVRRSRRIAARLPRTVLDPSTPPAVLTAREREIAELAGRGLTNRQIAARLRISARTVEHHLAHLFRKLDVPNRAGLASRLGDGPSA
ncbi:ATP-binding protein [Actinomadura rupiterrae]|uniref:ATP-binding protein n=1 Tax=Actinomadura rupiterrae TaxID=559627 RepID=UPI0020A42060|nr:helix-turn-helix transcriptional regulator [Actinomadura rupiterrae]MCP2342381.1 DNA-binding CsgD family transcriptional regulator/tetratricopeptide (TPR) repeat protein/predicted ATPase [Actinomadura rupiterrae]